MADPFGQLTQDDQGETLDYLGSEVPVSFKGQPALPVTGGPAVGSPVAELDSPGVTTTPPSTATGVNTIPGSGGGAGAPDQNWLQFIDPAIKLGNLANKLFNSNETPQSQATQGTPTGPEVPREVETPSATPTETPPFDIGAETPQGIEPPLGPMPEPPSFQSFSEPIPDEVVNMFGGDRGAIEAALQNASVSPDEIIQLADAGELSGLGIDSAAGLTPDMVSGLSNSIGIAGLILSGLKMAGVASGEASRVAGSLLSLASAGVSLSQAIPALTQLGVISADTAGVLSGAAPAAMSTASAVGAMAGGVTAVAAPFIAWGMHELEASMRPNLTPMTRRLNEQMFNATTDQIGQFNDLAARVREAGVTDPATLNQLMNVGEKALLDYYNDWIGVGQHTGIPGIAQDASPSGQVGGFDAETQGQMLAPYRQAMMELAALRQALGNRGAGSQDWYGIFGGQLNPWPLTGDTNPLGLNADQYNAQFTPEQLRAAAGGQDPLAFAIQQFAQSSPDWSVTPWPA